MDCQDQGECREGSEATEECGFCGTRTRLCGPECSWFEWSECTGQGECEAGLTGTWTTEGCVDEGFVRQATCNDSCQWEELQPCTGDCLITPRAGGLDGEGNPDFKDEVCIPAGPFLMGSNDGAQYAYPQHRVLMTPYMIDVYEVSISRYRACVTAGACTVPANPAQTLYFETGKEDHPISGITRAQALEFCAWDGGRTLPTEAQWEKAARGPEPREVLNPWGDSDPSCELANISLTGCNQWVLFPVDAYPLGVSYYGLFQTTGNVSEFSLGAIYNYEDMTENIDPLFTDTSDQWVIRGASTETSIYDLQITERSYSAANGYSIIGGLRCARRGY
jgi:formylglycine-generating enzyme required for sulfatase activity